MSSESGVEAMVQKRTEGAANVEQEGGRGGQGGWREENQRCSRLESILLRPVIKQLADLLNCSAIIEALDS